MKESESIVFFQAGPDESQIEVKLENETVWLTQSQMQELFQQTKQNVSLHIKNIFNEKELDTKGTVKKSLTVQKEGKRSVEREIEYYSLDVIISVGYRVKSHRGTQFRIWANKVLEDYLTKGYSIDKSRFVQQSRQLEELRQTVKLLGNVVESKALNTEEATGLLKVITDYTYALDVLDQYDHQVLKMRGTTKEELFQISYKDAVKAITGLKDKFGGSALFGNEKDESFQGSLAAIYGPLMVRTYILVSKKRRPTFYILSQKTIPFRTAIKGSQPFYLYGLWRKTVSYTDRTVQRR